MWHSGDYLLIENWILRRLPPKFDRTRLYTVFIKNFLHPENLLWKSSASC